MVTCLIVYTDDFFGRSVDLVVLVVCWVWLFAVGFGYLLDKVCFMLVLLVLVVLWVNGCDLAFWFVCACGVVCFWVCLLAVLNILALLVRFVWLLGYVGMVCYCVVLDLMEFVGCGLYLLVFLGLCG